MKANRKVQKILILVLIGLISASVIGVFVASIMHRPSTKVVIVPSKQDTVVVDTPRYMDHPSKCYSCEAQLGEAGAWQGQKTKCFSCEQSEHIESPYDAHPIRYY